MPQLKLSQTPEPLRTARLKYIDTRWDQLLRLVEDTELRALKYLSLTNAGGAVATLSFLGSSDAVRKLLLPKIALGSFLLGLFLVGVLVALGAHRMARLHEGWKSDANKYTSDQIPWGSLTSTDEQRVAEGQRPLMVIAYLSFLCFIAGCAVGLWALFSV